MEISIDFLERKYGFKQGTKIFVDGGHECKDKVCVINYKEGINEIRYIFIEGGVYLIKNLKYKPGEIYSWPDEYFFEYRDLISVFEENK